MVHGNGAIFKIEKVGHSIGLADVSKFQQLHPVLEATVCAADMQNKDGVGHVLEVHTEHCVDNLAGHVLTLKTIIY